ncbi:Kazal-type serine protease inhibitor domain-containing protein [Chelativorans sp. AA-79]|uniref:Kazal-type serine protease inhibitor domain-containing protein n=1 Tax=Chelativorans sp. AA-79 TaxID=3028735 RepID=UPI003211E230
MSGAADRVFAFIVVIIAMTACTVAVEQRPIPGRPQVCTFEHAPVCARRGNQQRTFANACLARSSGFQVLHRGQCRASFRPITGRPIACAREFAPVCAVRGSTTRTFDNECLARASGFRPIRPGLCRWR